MLYPQNLIYVNLFDALHRDKSEMKQKKRLGLLAHRRLHLRLRVAPRVHRSNAWCDQHRVSGRSQHGVGLLRAHSADLQVKPLGSHSAPDIRRFGR
jgi:hypothetical protein